jgi:hypothetical protein
MTRSVYKVMAISATAPEKAYKLVLIGKTSRGELGNKIYSTKGGKCLFRQASVNRRQRSTGHIT